LKSIEYDKDAMLEKMNKLKVKDFKSVKDDFDRKYEEAIKNAPNEEKVIKGDISYNLGLLSEFKEAAIVEYLNFNNQE